MQLPDDEDVDGARGRQDPEYNDRLIMDTLENMGVRSAELAMEVSIVSNSEGVTHLVSTLQVCTCPPHGRDDVYQMLHKYARVGLTAYDQSYLACICVR